jgi:hypothetical protein
MRWSEQTWRDELLASPPRRFPPATMRRIVRRLPVAMETQVLPVDLSGRGRLNGGA